MKSVNSTDLAIFGGPKVITERFPIYKIIGNEERMAVDQVMSSGILSGFLAEKGDAFFGGEKVREFEEAWAKYFGVKHAVAVNSWTSGLIAAVGAIGIEPGDEVIVSPWTMSATATAILHWNAIPVFADIEEETFNLNPKSVEQNITHNTKAIIAVDIFGHPAEIKTLSAIARKYDLKLISDSAQAPGAFYEGHFAGTLADIGGYSLNYHKHIHTGEGGVLVTDNDIYAQKLSLIRNHAEAVVDPGVEQNLPNMVGYNFRMGEIEAAIGIEQLKKLPKSVAQKQNNAQRLSEGLEALQGLRPPIVRDNCTHSYYMYPMILDVGKLGIDRNLVVQALTAEGIEGLTNKYINIHLLPMYQKKIAYGSSGFPWSASFCRRNVSYEKGICPVAEHLNDVSYIGYLMCLHHLSDHHVDQMIQAFHKVWNAIGKGMLNNS